MPPKTGSIVPKLNRKQFLQGLVSGFLVAGKAVAARNQEKIAIWSSTAAPRLAWLPPFRLRERMLGDPLEHIS
jgi:hypothetical protein